MSSAKCSRMGGGVLTAQSPLFDLLFPTQGEVIERKHLAQSLKTLEDVEGVRLQWQRLIPATQPQTKKDKK